MAGKKGKSGLSPNSQAALEPGEHISEQTRGPDGKVGPKPEKVKVLSNRKQDELAAINHVLNNPESADTTHQQSNLRNLQKTDLGQLYRIKGGLEARKGTESAEVRSQVEWDGTGECPTCHRAAAVPSDGPGSHQAEKMLLERQLAKAGLSLPEGS